MQSYGLRCGRCAQSLSWQQRFRRPHGVSCPVDRCLSADFPNRTTGKSLGRTAVICAALLSLSGCIHPPRAPVQSAFGPQTEEVAGDPKAAFAFHTDRESRASGPRVGVDPIRTLERVAAARLKWQAEPPADYSVAEQPSGQSRGGPVVSAKLMDPLTTGALRGKVGYDAEAVISRLLDEGTRAARPICLHC